MWLYVFIVVSSSCLVFISGNENGVPQGSVLKTQSLQDGARAANTTSTFDIQRRNLRLYPEWFSQRIKKIAGKRFTNSNIFPQEHRAALRENVPTANYRRSNMYGLTSHSPIIVSDDIGDANNAPQSIPPGAELVDLPGNYQSLPPDDFHRLSYAHGPHPDLGDSDLLSMPEDDLRAFGHHHHRRHHHNLCNHHRLCLNGGTCIHHRHTRVRCSCRPGFHGHYCEIPAVTCLPNPCKNDGACTLHDKGFTCACAADFKGPSCMIPASCFSNPCQNGASCVELEAGFRCQCNPDYEGTLCDERISLCRNSPCKNGGVCKEEGTSFECICKEGYSCQDCSCNTTTIIKQTTKQSSCPASSCKNGASCIVTDHGYSCQCMDGFHGEDCGIPDLCKRNPCENGGICVQVGSDYKCICSYGYKGINCNLPLSCVSHPCINGGNCHETDLDFHCKCGLGFKGETCQELNPCSHSPCANNAKCIERGPFYTCICQEGFRGKECKEKDPCSPSPCINGLCGEIKTGIAVCNCTEGWAGDLCELRNECFPNRCQNGGTCTHNGESYHCLCPIKYHGTSCELINPCSTDPCKNSGTCQITETGYICSCVDGHRGSHCEISSSCHPNPCHHGGRCYEGEHQYICECETGYAGKLCEVQAFCDANPCMNGGQCLEDIGTYSCHCPFGYLGKTCDQSICQPNPCKNGGTCIASNTEHGYACECSFPYHGHDCSEWDPCVPNPCNNGGQCKSHLKEINELHLHEGAIQGLLHGADESVVDVVEPEEESLGDDSLSMHHHPDLYEEHDQATNSEVTHIPHKELRKHLPKLDSDHHTVWPDTAESHIHDENAHDPWHEHSDGFKQHRVDTLQEHVSRPIDGTLPAEREQQAVHRHEYDDEEELVHQYKTRHPHLTNDDDDDDPADRHRKHHPHLYEEDGDRVHAEATQFKSHSGGLQAEVQSLNDEDAKVHGKHDKEVESFSDEDAKVHRKHDKEISQKIDSSTVEEITKNVVKAVLDQKAKNSKRGRVSKRGRIPKKITGHGEIRKRTLHNLYVCECPPGFLGAHCQHANPCQNSPCQNGGICLPRGNRYQCQCMSGYAGFHCDDLHPCDPSPCLHKGSCRLAHNVRGYHCDCIKGYRGYQCEKLDSCANGNPCQHGGKCANTNIGMECRCRQRYGGNLCEVDKCEGCSTNAHCKQGHCVCKPGFIGNGYKCKSIGDICSPDPCENAGKCVPGQDGKIFICQCKSGFTGSRCEFFNPCQSSPCRHNGLCVDSSNSRSKGIILVEHTDYKCFCPQGYRGKDCEETSLAACSSVPCLNNATCFDASDEKYRRNMKHPDDYECYCKNGYSGKQCEYPHYACWTHPCQNGGSCLDPSVLPEVSFDSHGYKCNCLPGYIGRNCEVTLHGPSPCYSAPCLHNGRCVDVTSNTDPDLKFDDLDDYKCFCNVMYSGKNCEVPFPACTSAPCYHNGTCLDGTTHPDFNFDETNYHCLCSPGFEGKNCERQYTFASPEEEEQILHPTEPPDFEPLTPTPMVIYERPPRTTPPMGKLEKANPAVVVVKHKDFEQNRLGSAAAEPPINHPSNVKAGQMDIPIEDIAIHQAKERAEHRLGTSKDGVESTEKEQESSVVHIAPDNGSPGGAVAVVNQMPKDRSSDAAMARMVSVVPDAVTSQGRAVTPPGGVVSPPNAAASPPVGSPNIVNYTPQANAYMRSMAQRQAQAQQRAILQQQMQQRYAAYNAPAARSYQGYNYYAYPRGPMLQNAQARSLASKITGPLRNNWHQFYNRYVQQRQFSSNRGKKSKIPKSTSTKL